MRGEHLVWGRDVCMHMDSYGQPQQALSRFTCLLSFEIKLGDLSRVLNITMHAGIYFTEKKTKKNWHPSTSE